MYEVTNLLHSNTDVSILLEIGDINKAIKELKTTFTGVSEDGILSPLD
jgi:hypothetical protein